MYKIGIIGYKLGMTQLFTNTGDIVPVTLVKVPPCIVTEKKLVNLHGYNAIQLGSNEIKAKKLSKPLLGYFTKNKIKNLKNLKEFKISTHLDFFKNQVINIDIFNPDMPVIIQGFTIGKGNSGNIKKNNFKRGPVSHGSKHHRLQGSLGAGTTPSRVFPGKKMAGRLGYSNCTIKGLFIKNIDHKNNILYLKGSVPGKAGNKLYILQ